MWKELFVGAFRRVDGNWEALSWTAALILIVGGVGAIGSIFAAIPLHNRGPVGPISALALMISCGILVAAPILAVIDRFVLRVLAGVPDSDDSRYLPIIGWGILSGVAVLGGTVLGGAIVGWSDADLLAAFLVVIAVWDGMTPAVSAALFSDRRSLSDAVAEGWRRQRADPLRTTAAGVAVAAVSGFTILVATVTLGWTLLCLFLFWLAFPLFGLVLVPPSLAVVVLTYVYSRALKLEAYQAAGEALYG